MDKVAEEFRAKNQNNPRNDKYGKKNLQLQFQLRVCNNKDPTKKQEKYFNPFFLRQFFHGAITSMQLSITNLSIPGLFFAMISCKYVKVTVLGVTAQKYRTDHPGTFQAQSVFLHFEDKNNGKKMDRNTQEATGDPVLCKFQSSVALVQNTLNLPGEKLDTPI